MWILILPMLAQAPEARVILEAEHARESGVPSLQAAARRGDATAQRLAARAIGRLENPAHRDALIPLLSSSTPAVRAAAVGALAQLRTPYDYGALLATERDPSVRAVIHDAIGRARPVPDSAELWLVRGLTEADEPSRLGAARGLESLVRLNQRTRTLSPATIGALRAAFAANPQEQFRELALLALNAAGDRDSSTLAMALVDPSPQVKRLGVLGSRRWINDTSAIVRYQSLRTAGTCEIASYALNDESDHVSLAAIDAWGEKRCDAVRLAGIVSTGRSWRHRAHAIVALAGADPAAARPLITRMRASPIWQLRVHVAQAARTARDSATLALLARDSNPNVAIAAMSSVEDAMSALGSDHAGLLLAAAEQLKGATDLKDRLPAIIAAFNRLTAGGRMTVRDPRVALLTRIGEARDTTTNVMLRDALYDRDPAVAILAASILTARTARAVTAHTLSLPIPPIPPADYIADLAGATARITLKGLGVITVALLTDDAPVTVGVFAQLAESGQYNGLTFHRIVPNFVVQGGSPGADEFDGLTRDFMRDEVGTAQNARGTIGISTRGRDTGDGQIYFNLVDNFRLDRDYTVLARMVDGFSVMDRIQEGDVIERIEVVRRPGARRSR